MTDQTAARDFLISEVEALEPFEFVAVVPAGSLTHMLEVTRAEDGRLELRVPGRPPMAPELPVEIRAGLQDRGLASDEPSDPTKPWVVTADAAEAAVDLLQRLLVEVFGEKPNAKLDVGHGSHREEHEAQQKLAIARARIEAIVTNMTGKPPEKDADGDYMLPVDQVHVMIAPRAAQGGQVVVRIFAITNVAVNIAPELGLFLSRLNFGLMFGRFALDTEHRSIWFDETLLGEEFREEELRFAIGMVASTADTWDDRLKQMFGGSTYQEVLVSRTAEPAPKTKPGEGMGLYL